MKTLQAVLYIFCVGVLCTLTINRSLYEYHARLFEREASSKDINNNKQPMDIYSD